MRSVKIGKFDIGSTRGLLAVSIFGHDAGDIISRFDSGHYDKNSLYEIRYDMFDLIGMKDLERLIMNLSDRSIDYIFTFRSDDGDMLKKIYRLAIDLEAPAVDADYSARNSIQDYGSKSKIILSYHAFSRESVNSILSKIGSYDCDVFKIAIRYPEPSRFFSDIPKILKFRKSVDRPVSFIPMGTSNSFLRIISAIYASDLSYAMDEAATAEGQIKASDFRRIYDIASRLT